ncbi:MAG: cytochrome c biogenesis protein CcdA, partial [Planctomycetia bacterium]|nr:cytochrome c biogenesis protein CcdA [Planctomycetia bacterium]
MKRFDSFRFVVLILALVLFVGSRNTYAAPRKPIVKPAGNTTFEGFDPLKLPSRENSMLPPGVSSVSAYIVPVKDQSQTKGANQLGWLVVEISLKPTWHVYSMRQKSGGYPTKIRMEETVVSGQTFHVGDFEAATPTESELFQGNVLEEMKGQVAWIAPVTGSNVDPALLKSLTFKGELDALACSEGTNGACHPLNVPLVAKWDDQFDIAPYLTFIAKANATLDAFSKEQSGKGTAQVATTQASPKAAFSWTILFWAFCGGLLLNVMPCVLPVIGLKIVSFFEQAGQSRSRAFVLNLWYTLGMLCVFVSLAMMSVGLSYLFTYGLFQIVMGSIVFVMALSLMGLWELQVPAFLGGQKSGKLMEKEGGTGAFFKGIITTLLAIPCGAPLLSPALVWSDSMIQQGNTFMVLFVYIVIGLGMAFPYLVVGAFPELLGFLPKPGLWMETFRIAMGYVLLVAVVWILFSMPQTLVIPTITLLFALWFGCWFIGRLPFDATGKQKTRAWLVSLTVVAVVILLSFN